MLTLIWPLVLHTNISTCYARKWRNRLRSEQGRGSKVATVKAELD